MTEITKENIEAFKDYYHYFHDSYIENVNYDEKNNLLELYLDVFWSGKPILREDNTFETNRTKMKILFKNVKEYVDKEGCPSYIDDAYINFVTLDKEYFCFAIEENDPDFYVLSLSCEYEEI